MSRQIMTPEIETKIVQLYEKGLPAGEILKKIKVFKTTKTVYDTLKKFNINTRSQEDYHYERNSGYFSRIDTVEKAYILGLLITDGWITSNRTAIGFSSTDRCLTKLLMDELGVDDSRIVKVKKKNEKCKLGYQFQINDSLLKRDLEALGFVVEKSRNTFLPSVPERLNHALLRGCLDGDGCVHKLHTVNQTEIVFYSGTSVFLKQISSVIYNHLWIQPPPILPSDTIYKICYSQEQYVERLGNWIWQDGPFLSRKYNIWSKYHGKNSGHTPPRNKRMLESRG